MSWGARRRNEDPTADDLIAMAQIVQENRSRSLGFTSSRTMLHRALDGEPVRELLPAQKNSLQWVKQSLTGGGVGSRIRYWPWRP